MSTTTASGGPTAERMPRKAALASFVGSALEYYDFFIYGAAAGLVFPDVFFPDSDPTTGTLLSLATFGVAYVARPIGAVVIGHFGDKVGRKKMLVLTLLMMGASTFLIGALPSYAAVGVAAPVLLVLLRILQGLSAAGEQSGANSMTLEHAPEGRRGFFTSFTLQGTQGGLILANLVFLLVALMPEDQLLSWGWRIPFFLSALVVAVGYWVRRSLPETPEFEREKEQHAVAKLPSPSCSATTGPRSCGSSSARWSRWSAPSSAPGRWRRAPATRSAWSAPPCSGWSSCPTRSRWSPSRCGRCCPTASAAVRCSPSAPWGPR